MAELFLSLERVSLTINGQELLQEISLEMESAEQWALLGASGAGKTLLAETIAGRHFYKGSIRTGFGNEENYKQRIAIVEQQSKFKDLSNLSQFYYQQRYNASDAGLTITVAEALEPFRRMEGEHPGLFTVSELLDRLQLAQVLAEPLIQLSSGEQKRFQILKALTLPYDLLILDQPMTALDIRGREIANDLFQEICGRGKNLLLVCSPDEIPAWITHLAWLDKGRLINAGPKSLIKEFLANESQIPIHFHSSVLSQTSPVPDRTGPELIRMVDVHVRYGEKIALDHIDWEMKRGEKWSISGPNGAGKSTLLSLITADHPQAYANEIYLFGRRRGSGESIWDIKQKIGFVSAELHSYFDRNMTCFQALASGFFDTIGLYRQLDSFKAESVMDWFSRISLSGAEHRLLSEMPLGKQRLILLARALIKRPPLLILDEPCQGLDASQAKEFRLLIDQFAQMPGSSLIYVSHYPHEIPEFVNQFFRLENGRMV